MINKGAVFWIVITAIITLSRFYQLVEYPPNLTIDEVSIGYNAYSILKTGRDEWGNPFPATFRSVGDYKSPVLIYLTVPFVKFLGLTELATRLPIAIFSAINILLFWLLLTKHIYNPKHSHLAHLTTVIFSLSPWLINFSRSGFEAVLALTFFLANLIYIFEFRKSGRLLSFFLMYVFALLSAISYHSTKLIVPLLNIIFLLASYRQFVNCVTRWYTFHKIYLAATFLFITITMNFFLGNFILGSGAARAGMTFLSKDYDYTHGLIPKLNHHPFSLIISCTSFIGLWFKRYLEYFSASYYLSTGLGLATPGHPGQGVIYAIEFPFFIAGFFSVIFSQRFFSSSISRSFVSSLLIGLFLLSLFPASITNNSQHALRTLNAVPVVSIFIAIGITTILDKFKSISVRTILLTIISAGYIVGICRFVDYYTLHYPVELSEFRSYGWKQLALFADKNHFLYDNVYVDPRFGTNGPYTFGVPHLYLLFYSKFDPWQYQQDPRRTTGSTDFSNYIFGPIDWSATDHSRNSLYLGSPWSFPPEVLGTEKQKFHIQFLNQSSGLYAISNR